MIVAIDIGNSFIKWKLYSSEQMALDAGRIAHGELESWIEALRQYPLTKVCLVNVLRHDMEEVLCRVFSDVEIFSFKSSACCSGVINGYQQPEKLGADRFLAAIEAYHLAQKKPVCVVDLGTAATIDVVDEKGLHQGGYIAPGLTLMMRALQISTEQIQVGAVQVALGYGKNTTQAVKNGVLTMLGAWINQELNLFQKKYPAGVIYLTGGDAEKILPLLEIKKINVYNDLLLDGLLRIAMNSGEFDINQ